MKLLKESLNSKKEDNKEKKDKPTNTIKHKEQKN